MVPWFRLLCLALLYFLTIQATAQIGYTAIESPEGGPVSKILQADNGDLYLLSNGGTLYRSSTLGESWTELPYNAAVFKDFALAGDSIILIDNRNVFVSANQGQTFSQEVYFASTWLTQIVVLPNKKLVLVGQEMFTQNFPLYISSDLGLNWTQNNSNILSSFPDGQEFAKVFATPNSKIIVPTLMGEIVSVDEGQTFQVSHIYSYELPLIAFDNTRIYSLTYGDFVRSDYDMQTWTDIRSGLPTSFFGGLVTVTASQKLIWVNPMLITQQVWMSSDGGATWQQQGDLPALGEDFSSLVSYSNRLLLAGSHGVYASDDYGQTWSKKNSGLHCGNYQDILLKNSKLVLVADPYVYTKKLNQAEWTENKFTTNFNFNLAAGLKGATPYRSNEFIVYGSQALDVKGSFNSDSWTPLVARDGSGGGNRISIAANHDTLYAAVQFFFSIRRLMPDSLIWGRVKNDWTNNDMFGVWAMAESKNNHRLVAYFDKTGAQFLAKTTKDFDLISKTGFPVPNEMKSIGGVVFAGNFNTISMSKDDGDTWSYSTDVNDNNFKMFTDKQGRLLVGMTGKFKVSLDTGKTWTTYAVDNFTNHVVAGIATDSLGYVYLAVNEVGILKSQFSVDGSSQKIIFDPIGAKKFGDQPFHLTAHATSGLPVTFGSSDTSIATIDGNLVTIHKAGSVDIIASQAGNESFDPATAKQTLIISKADQQINFQVVTAKIFGDQPFVLTASSTSGLSVTFASSDTSKVKIIDNLATIKHAGYVVITASQAGNDYYKSATATQSLTIQKADQQIDFQQLTSKTYGDQPFTLTASSTSGLPVTFASSDTSIVKITGNVATIRKAGAVDITASQVGNGNYNSSMATQSLTIGKADQLINFQQMTSKTYGDQPFTLTASSTSGLSVTFASSDTSIVKITGNVATIRKAGAVDITASQVGNGNYNSSMVTQSLTIAKADQQIQFTAPSNKTQGDGNFTLHAVASSRLPVSFSSSNTAVISVTDSTAVIHAAGAVSITATQSGNANYFSVSKTVSFCVLPQTPTVIEQSDNKTLTSSSTTGNQWYLNGSKIAGANEATFVTNTAGSYAVKVTVDTCGSHMSAPMEIKVVTGDIIPTDLQITPIAKSSRQ